MLGGVQCEAKMASLEPTPLTHHRLEVDLAAGSQQLAHTREVLLDRRVAPVAAELGVFGGRGCQSFDMGRWGRALLVRARHSRRWPCVERVRLLA